MIAAERLQQIEQLARRYGSANCFTGDTGTLAAAILELLTERHLLDRRLARYRRRIRDARPGWCDTSKVFD